ncbi:hypothetical protein [Streptomyces sp. NPDC019890]|uniref:hypothetical protein n=1 Tax=Streptomyces sp. NPDC019890 TaxID=3365064 RepID=UPI00384EEA11
MNAMHQYMLDSYRASQHGTKAPPQPGLHDWQAARELTTHGAARRARHPRGRVRSALARLFHSG